MTTPISPQDSTSLVTSSATKETETDPKLSNSPFAAMFKGGATVEELQQFINGCLKMVAREIKRTQERWEKSQRRMRQIMDGQIPDEFDG